MTDLRAKLSEQDLAFMAETLGRRGQEEERLVSALRDDPQVFQSVLAADRLFQRFTTDPEILIKVSPRLYFAVLLQRAARDLRTAAYTIERSQRQRIPVFDTAQVADFADNAQARDYLADMLASFTKVQSYSVAMKVQHGVWRRLRFSDIDIDGLIRFASTLDKAQRFGAYRRIADICLLMAGMFAEYVEAQAHYPATGQRRPQIAGRRRTMEEYQDEGRAFYQMAAKHQAAGIMGLDEILAELASQFLRAQKTLSYMAERYLWFDKRQLFAS